MKKVLLGIVVLTLLGAAGAAWWLHSSLDSQVASAIRKYGSEITGVTVNLSSVKIGLTDGTAALHGLVIGNPKGFKTERALALGEVSMKLDIGSLTQDVILIREISIIKPDVTYEYASGGSNLDVIQRHVERYVSENIGGRNEPKNKGQGKKMVIENVYIKSGKASVSAEILNGKAMSVSLPDLHMKDIGRKSNGATAGEAASQVLGGMTQSVTRSLSPLNLGGAVDSIKKGAGVATDKIKGLFQ